MTGGIFWKWPRPGKCCSSISRKRRGDRQSLWQIGVERFYFFRISRRKRQQKTITTKWPRKCPSADFSRIPEINLGLDFGRGLLLCAKTAQRGPKLLSAALLPVELVRRAKRPPPRRYGVRSSAQWDMEEPAMIQAMA